MINDVWYNFNERIYFLTRNTFDQAPSTAGVYAWYYPLRVSTYDLKEFINEVLLVMAYDSISGGTLKLSSEIQSSWRRYKFDLTSIPTIDNLPKAFIDSWNKVTNNDFDSVRKDLMRFSLFMPPLYVGKTNSLVRRINEHVNGKANTNSFKQRFEEFAKSNSLSQQSVGDLLCVAVTSTNTEESEEYVNLMEYIMKILSAPGFSIQ